MAPFIHRESYWFTETTAEDFAEDHSKYPNKHLNTYQYNVVNPHLPLWQTQFYMVRLLFQTLINLIQCRDLMIQTTSSTSTNTTPFRFLYTF